MRPHIVDHHAHCPVCGHLFTGMLWDTTTDCCAFDDEGTLAEDCPECHMIIQADATLDKFVEPDLTVLDLIKAFRAGVGSTNESFNGEVLIAYLVPCRWGAGGTYDTREGVTKFVQDSSEVDELVLGWLKDEHNITQH